MGVPGLWERLEKASSGDTSLANMAWSTYNPRKPEQMLRIGIDASIWLVQTATVAQPQYPHHSLQILFHKLAKMLALPVRLLFVFDGRDRPSVKRGKQIFGRAIGEEKNFRQLIEAFGYEHWTAPGEAEAELGYLSHIGSLDLVISEDVDSLIFKTTRLLLRTKLESTKADQLRFNVFYKQDLEEKLQVDESALILCALMSGGDYDETGLMRCGPKVSFALGQAGFGRQLVHAYKTQRRIDLVDDFLPDFRESIADVLRRNPDDLLGRRFMKLADSITDAFPNLDALDYYVNPLTSASRAAKWKGFSTPVGRPDLARLGKLMQAWQEWDEKDVLTKFRATVWEGVVCRTLMEEMVQPGIWEARCQGDKVDAREARSIGGPSSSTQAPLTSFFGATRGPSAQASSSKASMTPAALPSSIATVPFATGRTPLVSNISRFRKHASTDELLEYRITVDPARFVAEVRSAQLAPSVAKSYEPPPSSDAFSDGDSASDGEKSAPASSSQAAAGKNKKAPMRPEDPLLLWVPYKMLRVSHPALVGEFNCKEEAKLQKKREKAQRVEDRANGVVRPNAAKSPTKTRKPKKGAEEAKGKGKGRELDSDLSNDPGLAVSPFRNRVESGSGALSLSASSSDSFPDFSASPSKPKTRSRPLPKKKPTYVELSDSDRDDSPSTVAFPSSTPKASLPAATDATAKRPTRRRPVSETPSPAAGGDASSGNPSPQKSPRTAQARARALPALSSDDHDDELFPADPFAAEKARKAAKTVASAALTSASLAALEQTATASESRSILPRDKPRGSQKVTSSPRKTRPSRPRSASITSEGVEVIELGSSPAPAPTKGKGRHGGGDRKSSDKTSGLGRQGSNPWTKARRATSAKASNTGGGGGRSVSAEIIDLTDD